MASLPLLSHCQDLITMNKRFNGAVIIYHHLANLLHPQFRGKNLSTEAEEKVRQMFITLYPDNPESLSHLCAFIVEASPFPASLMLAACIDRLSPGVW